MAAAHACLQDLTRTQRSLDAYAGDRTLLAQDWRDRLAELARSAPATAAIPDEVLAAIAALPDPAALALLLNRPDPALPALETAMTAADKARRRQLAAPARLVARRVPAALFAALGAEALGGLDHPDADVRLRLLARVVAWTRSSKSPAGVTHLLTWLDDPEARVRTAACDWLVRLGDERKTFKQPWTMAEDGLFPPALAQDRLRRLLRRGGSDEQVAALMLAAAIAGKDLAGEATACLLSPEGMVADTALEAIKALDAEEVSLEVLLRLAADPAAPPARRARAIALLAEAGEGKRPLASFDRLTSDPEPLVAAAAVRALAKQAEGPGRRSLFAGLMARGEIKLALDLVGEQPRLADLGVLGLGLRSQDPAQVGVASRALLKALAKTSVSRHERTPGLTRAQVLQRFPLDARFRLGIRVWLREPGWPALAALAIALDAGQPAWRLDGALGLLAEAGPEARDLLAEVLVGVCARRTDRLERLLAAGTPLPEHATARLIDAVVALAGCAADRLPLYARHDLTGELGLEVDHNYSDGLPSLRLDAEGGSVHLRSRFIAARGRQRPWDSEGQVEWRVDGSFPWAPDADGRARLAAALAHLPVDEQQRNQRDTAVAVVAGSPLPANLDRVDQDLLRIAVALDPARRPAVVAQALAHPADWRWAYRGLLVDGEPDLVPVLASVLAEEHHYLDSRAYAWLASLPPAALAPLLPRLAADREHARELDPVFKRAQPLPLDAALALFAANRLGALTVAPYGQDQAAALHQALAALTAERIASQSGVLRRLRAAGGATFDGVLARLCAPEAERAVAWLRSGLPAEAGLRQAYLDAENAQRADLRLVGLAFALKEGRRDFDALLALMAKAPPAVQADAALVAQRQAPAALKAQAATVAATIATLPAQPAIAWLAVCEPAAELPAAVAGLVRANPQDHARIGAAIAARLRSDRPGWEPVAKAAAAAAGGRLDWLIAGR
ncbi:MAG: hypothetical protein L6R48_20690 [Planctomycetes bacterium]|nr:hypothetical protein [Planctomycetota bacterium]